MLRLVALLVVSLTGATRTLAAGVSICTFASDATPPLGSPLCYSSVPPAKEIVDPLSVRGIVILSDAPPVVLCAVDWVGIGNGAL